MSSSMKDARWMLAKKIGDAAGFDFMELDYEKKAQVLTASQKVLDTVPVENVTKLAAEWNAPENE